MTSSTKILSYILISIAALGIVSCSDNKSYAELLTDETKNVNAFLANQKVINEIPEDSIFEAGEDAPYYRIDETGNIYMQVVKYGSQEKAEDDQQVYFRYTRYNLSQYNAATGKLPEGMGNSEDLEYEPTWFRFKNFTLTSSSQYGAGIQMPLYFLPLGSEANVVIKSQYGMTSEISYVTPFLYNVRYYKGKI